MVMMTMIKLKKGYFGHDDDGESDDGGKVFVEPRRNSGLKARWCHWHFQWFLAEDDADSNNDKVWLPVKRSSDGDDGDDDDYCNDEDDDDDDYPDDRIDQAKVIWHSTQLLTRSQNLTDVKQKSIYAKTFNKVDKF